MSLAALQFPPRRERELDGVAECDVLVIGGGLAGAMAALSAREQSASVIVVRPAAAASRMWSGAVDVASGWLPPPCPFSEAPSIGSNLRHILRHFPWHPYVRIGEAEKDLPAALEFAARELPQLGFPAVNLDESNGIFASTAGGWKSSAFAARPAAAGDLRSRTDSKVCIAGFSNWPSCDAPQLAAMLQAAIRAANPGCRFEAAAADLGEWPEQDDPSWRTPRYLAAMLDANRQDWLPRWAEKLNAQTRDASLLLLPPLMGTKGADVCEELSSLTGKPCAELLSRPPSIFGERLHEALESALESRGVRIYRDRAGGFLKKGDRLEAIVCDNGEVKARMVVLAHGKFASGGLVRDSEFSESVFNLPLFVRGEPVGYRLPEEFLSPQVGGEHLIFEMGVKTDTSGRPLDEDDRVIWSNLVACGSCLMGYSQTLGISGAGAAIYSGWRAGRIAAAG
ncbi:MAG: Anaerobic glycerol-3-phosphate dehydrogenase subunit B [Myxococcota bacterium]|nr:Anaerobic glycerol-3-phosphate dehydrogenase subunit B [Myxococcota bacterium]